MKTKLKATDQRDSKVHHLNTWTQLCLKSSAVCGLWSCRTRARCNCRSLANIAPHLSSNLMEYKKHYQLKYTNSTDIQVLLFQKQNFFSSFTMWPMEIPNPFWVSAFISLKRSMYSIPCLPWGKSDYLIQESTEKGIKYYYFPRNSST